METANLSACNKTPRYTRSYEFGGRGAKPAVKGLYGNKKMFKKEDSRSQLTLPHLSKYEGTVTP